MRRVASLVATVTAVLAMIACSGSSSSPSTTSSAPTSCGSGTTLLNGVCQLNTTITINSTLQTGIPTFCSIATPSAPSTCSPVPPTCFSFSPNPASVKSNVAVQWQNNTSTAVTIIDAAFKPLVTVNGNATSGGIVYTSAGGVSFGIQTCANTVANSNSAFYGQLNVTVN